MDRCAAFRTIGRMAIGVLITIGGMVTAPALAGTFASAEASIKHAAPARVARSMPAAKAAAASIC